MDYREQNTVFVDMMGVSYPLDVLYSSGQGTQLFEGSFVTPNSFEFLGVIRFWAAGFGLKTETDSESVFAMSYRLWSKDFNPNPGSSAPHDPRRCAETLVGSCLRDFFWPTLTSGY